MIKKICLTILLLLLTSVSSSEAAFTAKATRPTLTNLLSEAVLSDRGPTDKEEKIIEQAGYIANTLSLLASNDNFTVNDIPAAELANRTAANQILADTIKNLSKLESILNKLAKTKSFDTIYYYTEEPVEFTGRARLMKEQAGAAKKWLIEYRLFAGSDLSRENQETVNDLYIRHADNAANGYETWQSCWEQYYTVFDSLNKFFIPEEIPAE